MKNNIDFTVTEALVAEACKESGLPWLVINIDKETQKVEVVIYGKSYLFSCYSKGDITKNLDKIKEEIANG